VLNLNERYCQTNIMELTYIFVHRSVRCIAWRAVFPATWQLLPGSVEWSDVEWILVCVRSWTALFHVSSWRHRYASSLSPGSTTSKNNFWQNFQIV